MNKALDTSVSVKLFLQRVVRLVHFIAMIRFLSILLLLCFYCAPAYSQEDSPAQAIQVKVPRADLFELKHTKSGRIDKVIDGLTLLLKDGTIVRLSSLRIPDFHIWEQAVYSEQALGVLNKLLPEKTQVMLYQTRDAKRGRENRMQHQLVHLVIKDKDIWIQGALLARGLAQVQTTPKSTQMLSQMLNIEDKARSANIGLWSPESDFRTITIDNAEEFIGDFVVLEGVVQKVASVRNDIYLNFGKDWKKDFTIMVPSGMRKEFSKQGINIMSLAKTPIRVRGNLREYNGPLIELDNSADLEIMKSLQSPSKNLNLAP